MTSQQEGSAGTCEPDFILAGSRIEFTGFSKSTPTTIVLVGNTNSGSAPVDLRGLEASRDLKLVNGGALSVRPN